MAETVDIETGSVIEPPAGPSSQDVGKAARQGGVWAFISYGFSKVAGFASSIVLARLLMPEQFGLIAMANTVVGMVQIIGVWGLGAAVLYQREEHEQYANTAWWIDVILGIILFVLVNVASPLAALYYHEPRVRLIIFAVSFNYLINPLGNMMDFLLRREFRFKDSTRVGLLSGFIVSGLTIIFAVLGAGVWSFVFPSIIGAMATVALRWHACRFRPSLPVRWDLAAKLFGFGKHLFGSGALMYINQNVDYILVGGLLGGKQLGFYLFAYNLGTWIVMNISGVISGVLFPTVTRVRDDHERASQLFLRLVQVISIVGFPLVALQWAVAPLYFNSVYGAKWLPAIQAFRLISLYGMGMAVCQPALSLISAMGRPDINMKVSAATCPILITAIYLGSRGGINGVALATALAHGVFVWFYVLIPFRILKWDIRRFFLALCPALVCSVLSGVLTWFVYSAARLPGASLGWLGVLILFFGAVYSGSMILLFRGVTVSTFRMVTSALREARE